MDHEAKPVHGRADHRDFAGRPASPNVASQAGNLRILVDLYPLDWGSARSDWQAQFCGPLVTFGLTKRPLLLLEFGKLSLNVALMLPARRPNMQRLTHVLSPMAPSHLFNIVA